MGRFSTIDKETTIQQMSYIEYSATLNNEKNPYHIKDTGMKNMKQLKPEY